MKLNKMRDFMKYIAKYSLKNIAVFIAILLLVLIVFLFLTKKVIENVDNKDTNQIPIQSQSPIPNPNPITDSKSASGLTPEAKDHIDKQTNKITSITESITSHLNQNS